MAGFDWTISVGALIQTAAFLVAAIGLIYNAVTTTRAAREKRILHLVEAQNTFYNDDAMLEAYYLIEYGSFSYEADFHGSDLEKKVDRLLVHFENIAWLYQTKVVTIDELDAVAYNYLVIYQDEDIQRYFAVLDKWYARRGITEKPFATFREVGAVIEARRYGSDEVESLPKKNKETVMSDS